MLHRRIWHIALWKAFRDVTVFVHSGGNTTREGKGKRQFCTLSPFSIYNAHSGNSLSHSHNHRHPLPSLSLPPPPLPPLSVSPPLRAHHPALFAFFLLLQTTVCVCVCATSAMYLHSMCLLCECVPLVSMHIYIIYIYIYFRCLISTLFLISRRLCARACTCGRARVPLYLL